MTKSKSRLLKLMESDDDSTYETTESDCRHWFRILNREIFNNQLTPIDEFDIRRRRRKYAYYEVLRGPDGRTIKKTIIGMANQYQSKKFFVEILAHEMVHHYQILNGQPFGHGPSFLEWGDKLKAKGISLKKAYWDLNE